MGIFYLVKLNVANVEEMREKRDVKGLITALQSAKDARVRIHAERALGEIRDKNAVAPLIQALEDKDADIRFEAAQALGKIKSERAAEPLVQALADEDSEVRTSVVEALTSIGILAVEPLVQALADGKSAVRKSATEALNKLGWKPGDDSERINYLFAKKDWDALTTLGELAVERLILALQDDDWEIRMRAAEALGTIGDARAVEPLVQALNDDYWNVYQEVEKALGTIGESAIEPLILALQDENWNVRERAIGALGRITNKRVVVTLSHALNDEDSEVRKSAADVLDNLNWKPGDDPERVRYLRAKKDWKGLAKVGEPAVELLIQALKDKEGDVRRGAAEALGTIGDARAVKPLVQALEDDYWDVNKSAAEALGRIGEPAVESLILALEDQDAVVRRGAAKALGEIADKSAVVPLIQALKDKRADVRYEAAEALGNMGEPAAESLILALNDRESDVRKKAAEALGKVGDVKAIEPLVRALKDRESDVRKRVTKTLDKLGWTPGDDTERICYLFAKKDWNALALVGEPAVKHLIPALEDGDSTVRMSAAEVLGEIGDVKAVGPLVRALKDEKARPSSRLTVQEAMTGALEKIKKKKK